MLNLLAARGADAEPFTDLARYTPYAVEFRYEGVAADAERISRQNAIAIVAVLLDRVRRELAGDQGA